MSNVETVQAIYQAFGRGDVATILDTLDDQVEWETAVPVPEVPWLRARRGKGNISGFFESMAPLRITRFEPHTIFDGGDKVFVLIAFEATTRGREGSTRFPTMVTCGSSTRPAKWSSTTTSQTPLRWSGWPGANDERGAGLRECRT